MNKKIIIAFVFIAFTVAPIFMLFNFVGTSTTSGGIKFRSNNFANPTSGGGRQDFALFNPNVQSSVNRNKSVSINNINTKTATLESTVARSSRSYSKPSRTVRASQSVGNSAAYNMRTGNGGLVAASNVTAQSIAQVKQPFTSSNDQRLEGSTSPVVDTRWPNNGLHPGAASSDVPVGTPLVLILFVAMYMIYKTIISRRENAANA